jgi:excisionase family DNA binding protein
MEPSPHVPAKPFLTVKEAAEIMGVCEDTVRSAIKTGQIPGRKVMRSYRLPRQTFMAWWTQQAAASVVKSPSSHWLT